MHPWLVDRLIFPLHERFKGKPTLARLDELERSQWLAPDVLRELQWRRVRAHLEYAYREVPYYTRLLDEHGLPPHRIQGPDDFARIPFLTKDVIRQRAAELEPRTRLRGVQRISTGGSTGQPVTVLVDRERAAVTDAIRLRAHRWFGVGMGAREIVLWGSSIELGRQDRLRSLRDRLINSRLLSAFDLGEPALARYATALRRDRPEKLYGYASALALLAGYLARQGFQAEEGWPRAVFTTAEPLFDFQRAIIESTFACPAAVEYGCRDGGLIANQCPKGGLHIAAEGMLVEVVEGEIVITNLASFAMPLIRYRTGDVGALGTEPCACGRGLPTLASLAGRQTDFLVAPDGRVMHALAAIYILREVSSVREFQVIQDRLDGLRVLVVPDGAVPASARAAIVAGLRRLMGAAADIRIEEVAAIPRLPSGKHRYVISAVAGEALGVASGGAGR